MSSELNETEKKVARAIGNVLAGAAMGCLVGGSVLVAVIVLIGLIRLLGWLVGL